MSPLYCHSKRRLWMEATLSRSPSSTGSSNPNTTTEIAGSRTSAASEVVRGNAAFTAAPPRASYRHKENERCLKRSVKIGTLYFSAAARDISATAKAASASHRRKILAEKNLYLAKGSCGCGHRSKEQRRALVLESKNPHCKSDDLDPFSISQMAETETPADAYPSLSPYDPYANYLALRPRFLYYRPNPRVKRHLLDGSGQIDTENREQIGDILSTENCEDTLRQFEEELPPDLPREYNEECTSYSESNSRPRNGRPLLLYKLACFILVLVIACFSCFCAYSLVSFSISRTPLITSMNDLHLRDYVAVSAVNITKLVKRMENWSLDRFAHYPILSNIPREQFGTIFLDELAASPVPQRLSIDYSSITGIILSSKEFTQENQMKKPLERNMEEEYIMERHEADVSREELEVGLGCEAEKRNVVIIQEMEENKRAVMQVNAVSGLNKSLQGGTLKCEIDNTIEEGGIKEMEWERRISGTVSEKNVMVDLRTGRDFLDVVTECKIEVNQDNSICLHSSSQIDSFGFVDISLTSCREDQPSSNVRSPEAPDFGVDDLECKIRIYGISKKTFEEEHTKRQDLAHNLATDCKDLDQDDSSIYSSSQIQSCGINDASLASAHKDEIFNNSKSQGASICGVNPLKEVERIDSIASEKNIEVEPRKRQDPPHHLAAEHLMINEDGDISSCSAFQMQSSSCGDIPLLSSQVHGSDVKYPVNLVMGLLFSVFLLLLSSVIVSAMWNQTPMVANLEITPSMQISKFVHARNENERYDKAMKSPCQNTAVDTLVNSGPSEFSNRVSVNQHRITKKEEFRPALSSTPISYGSFTTYEKLSSKKGNKREAAMMPVRRSSRIRNQITSP